MSEPVSTLLSGIDPRLNCAARICCDPPHARDTLISLLLDLGCESETAAHKLADGMEAAGVVLMPVQLAEVIAEIVQHPGRGTEATTKGAMTV